MISKFIRYIPIIDQLFRNNPILLPKKEGVMRIVTLGDSITEGSYSSNKKTKSYPSQLRKLLNDDNKFEVINLGLGGRTMMKTGDLPYWNEPAYQDILNSEPDIVILMLGTYDSKSFQWNKKQFHNDYVEMVRNI